ncbi:hypothetical protein POTOM_054502 [Populus tomentosa]|uniref:RING-type E3 ubiquitin transferase n=1 Tax=Populus tomentosa TaxID=118781 RepID=A0A8X7XZM0_POPTO|nr:hypothetical protein POTOM_054502 [Populus tomentosa]
MVFGFFDMVNSEGFSWRRGLGFVVWIVFWLWFVFLGLLQPVVGLRPLRERAQSWGDEWLFIRKDENDLGPFSMWNITGTYRGSWKFLDSTNSSSKFPDLRKSNGDSVIELFSRPTKINGVHYVQGVIIFHDVFNNEHNVGGAQIRVEGVYIWPFRQLRMVTNSGKEGELSQEEEYILSNPYHLFSLSSFLYCLLFLLFGYLLPSRFFCELLEYLKGSHVTCAPIYEMEKHCSIEIAAQITRLSSAQSEVGVDIVTSPGLFLDNLETMPYGDRDRFHIEGIMESPATDDEGECFSPLLLNATSVNIEVYYNKAVNYTLMVTFVSFLQVLLLIRQMEHGNTQSGAAKVSILMIGQQAIMDAYLCLLHLTAGILVGFHLSDDLSIFQFYHVAILDGYFPFAGKIICKLQNASVSILCIDSLGNHQTTGVVEELPNLCSLLIQQLVLQPFKFQNQSILVESLFNAFATAAFFKFVVFSIFEMRYLLAIWKASRPMNSGEGWETMRRELSVLYSRFYGILLGGILFMYEFHNYLRPILLLMYSFWIPQIITNVIRDSRKPLHPHYILGMTVTRLAIPLYIFGCPYNFMRIEPDKTWCICLSIFIGLQASILLLQHYLGSRCFIPRQILPEKYCYYRRFDKDANHATDCVICMTSIDLTHRSNDCMVTPCDHFFHSGCLQRWMDIKMECPTCRRPLPPA